MKRHGPLVATFVGVHLWLLWATGRAPNHPLSDVTRLYLPWVQRGLADGHWVGITTPWVYPVGALLPMLLVAALGLHHYGIEWLAAVTVLNGMACVCLTRVGRRGHVAAYWWLVFLAALGPVALARIDAMTIPVAIVAMLMVDRRPGIAAAWLTLAAWVKVWPVALVTTILVASRSKRRVLVGSGGVAAVVIGIALLLGASVRTLTAFVTMQSGRGLQLESPAAVPWLWAKALGSTHVQVLWRPGIKTYEIVGPGTQLISHLLTPLMLLTVGALCAWGIRAARTNPGTATYLAPLALALTAALIVTNKVGSPQYETWLAPAVVLGLVQRPRGGPSFRPAAALGILVAALTQLVYPWMYDDLEAADVPSVILITIRNALLIVLLAGAAKQLITAPVHPTAHPSDDGDTSEPGVTPPRIRSSAQLEQPSAEAASPAVSRGSWPPRGG